MYRHDIHKTNYPAPNDRHRIYKLGLSIETFEREADAYLVFEKVLHKG